MLTPIDAAEPGLPDQLGVGGVERGGRFRKIWPGTSQGTLAAVIRCVPAEAGGRPRSDQKRYGLRFSRTGKD